MTRPFGSLIMVGLLAANGAQAESRFGRPVIKLAEPRQYGFFKLDDNNFPFLSNGRVSVSCMVYRGTKRYYVEVGVVNLSSERLILQREFVTFDKPGYTVVKTNTFESAVDVATSVAGPFIPAPPPPPTSATTTYSGTGYTYGNVTSVSGTATTTVDNSAAGWHALGQAIAARRYYQAQTREQSFAEYLAIFDYAKQPLVIEPKRAQLYIHTFQQVKPKKAPFRITVVVGTDRFEFGYRE